MTPPPPRLAEDAGGPGSGVVRVGLKKDAGSPIISPNQFVTTVSNSVQAGEELFNKTRRVEITTEGTHGRSSVRTYIQLNPILLTPAHRRSPKMLGYELWALKYAKKFGLSLREKRNERATDNEPTKLRLLAGSTPTNQCVKPGKITRSMSPITAGHFSPTAGAWLIMSKSAKHVKMIRGGYLYFRRMKIECQNRKKRRQRSSKREPSCRKVRTQRVCVQPRS